MSTITVRFTTRWPYNPMSPVIAKLTRSPVWSHTMTIIDGEAYEATMTHKCRVVPLEIAMSGVAAYRDMYVPVSDIEAAKAWGKEQNGKDYDWSGAIGLPFLMSEDWADESKWWCSELSFKQIWVGGTLMLDPAELKRVTPDDLHQCNYRKSQVIRLVG